MMNEIEMLRQDFRVMLTQVLELRRFLEGLEETKAKYMSIPQFAKEIGLSRSAVRVMCMKRKLKAVQPSNDRGRWKVLSSELVRLRQEAKANNDNKRNKQTQPKNTIEISITTPSV